MRRTYFLIQVNAVIATVTVIPFTVKAPKRAEPAASASLGISSELFIWRYVRYGEVGTVGNGGLGCGPPKANHTLSPIPAPVRAKPSAAARFPSEGYTWLRHRSLGPALLLVIGIGVDAGAFWSSYIPAVVCYHHMARDSGDHDRAKEGHLVVCQLELLQVWYGGTLCRWVPFKHMLQQQESLPAFKGQKGGRTPACIRRG